MSNNSDNMNKTAMFGLMVAAIGVVFGDIGTSPLYAFKECLKPFAGNGQISAENIYGVCSLIFWCISIIVTLKYVGFVMRADNKGEGGILALVSLADRVTPPKLTKYIWIMGLIGAATFYGDSVITPAISVLSAVEGIGKVESHLSHYIMPIAISIIFILFLFQRFGTQTVGKLFGPIMVIWFLALAGLGIYHIIDEPMIFMSLNPYYAIKFGMLRPELALIISGAVFLTLTGAEALYADMGHFGKKPINMGWFYLVFPCLILNYLGQGAMVLKNPALYDNPFYNMAPQGFLIPLVILATLATVIASQAVITGAYSMTKEAIQMGYCPRLHIVHTSENEQGQIYIPFVNWSLFVLVIILMLSFKNSDALSAAYGIAVVTTMVVTTILMSMVLMYKWNWSKFKIITFLTVFLSVDAFFVAANFLKIEEGGWVPLVFAGFIFLTMTTWKTGRKLVFESVRASNLDLKEFVNGLLESNIHKTYGTAIYMNSVVDKTSIAFMHNLKHNHIIHDKNIFITFKTIDYPFAKDEKRFEVTKVAEGFYQVIIAIGFKEVPDLPKMLAKLSTHKDLDGWSYNEMETSFFLSRETVISTPGRGMHPAREHYFAWMSKNAAKAAEYFKIPSGRVVELGAQVEI